MIYYGLDLQLTHCTLFQDKRDNRPMILHSTQ